MEENHRLESVYLLVDRFQTGFAGLAVTGRIGVVRDGAGISDGDQFSLVCGWFVTVYTTVHQHPSLAGRTPGQTNKTVIYNAAVRQAI